VILFRALHLKQTLYTQDYKMHNNVPRNKLFVFYDVDYQRKIEGCTTFKNNVFGEGMNNFPSVVKMTKLRDLLSVALKFL